MRLTLSNDVTKFLEPSAQLLTLTPSERLKISFKKFAFMLALAIASVFIPVLHFFLVPLFLILSFVLGFKAYATQYRLQFTKDTNCIECQKPLKNEVMLDESLRVKCNHCLVNYLVQP